MEQLITTTTERHAMYGLTWLAEQAADLESVIAALEAADLDATTYEKALASVERMMEEEGTGDRITLV